MFQRPVFGSAWSIRVFSALVFVLTWSPARATVYTWTDTAGGDYGDSDNWDPIGVPGATDSVVFDKSGTYTVDFSSAEAS